MRILVACEYSGIVRDAFRAKGHFAVSCDLLPTESAPGYHYQGNVLDIINDGWDMLIGHPPCTYTSYAANRVFDAPGREEKRNEAIEFFKQLYSADIPKICLENPRGYIINAVRSFDQEIYPYYFGEPVVKRICLWLKNLPPLQYSLYDTLFFKKTATYKPQPETFNKSGNPCYYVHSIKSGNRQKERSKFFHSVAQAMADQWG